MAEKDKVIKSGQLTLPRLLFLALIGGIIAATVALGGIWLSIGYWLLTLAICLLLYLVVTDYGIKIDRVDLTGQPAQTATIEAAAPAANAVRATANEVRVKRRSTRTAKRRR
jgi:hypothetical protein